MERSIGFIGGGRITRIILQALKNQNRDSGRICVYDINPETYKALVQIDPNVQTTDLAVAASQDIVFIALHPPVIIETLGKIKDVIKNGSTVISLAPKITIGNMASVLGNKNIVRLIPNATSVINKGYNPVCFGEMKGRKEEILNLLSALGKTFETEESKMEAYAIASAMLPTYFWFQWHEMLEIAGKMGLSEHESREAVEQTLRAALDVMFESGLTTGEVYDLIPVKPIGENEQQIRDIYQTRLTGLYEKIKPAAEKVAPANI